MASIFDNIPNRAGSYSMKWDKYKGSSILPLWVADMDFPCPEPVLKSAQKLVDHGVFGYSIAPDALTDVIVDRLATLHQWQVERDWIVYLPGLVPGLTLACEVVGADGDSVMSTVPVYGPFLKCPLSARKVLQKVPLKLECDRYTLDFDAIRAAITVQTKVFLLCNPYNPAGTVFTKAELETLSQICLEHNILLVSDEIHCDLVIDPTKKHLSVASFNTDIEQNSITLLSPSKTFNIAGLGGSFAVIPNDHLREKFNRLKYTNVPMLSAFAYQAMLASYSECEPWRKDLIAYLKTNHDLLYTAINKIPGLSMLPLDATYLAWVDATAHQHISQKLEAAGLGVSDGGFFFEGPGFFRLNFGTNRANVEEAIKRMERALG